MFNEVITKLQLKIWLDIGEFHDPGLRCVRNAYRLFKYHLADLLTSLNTCTFVICDARRGSNVYSLKASTSTQKSTSIELWSIKVVCYPRSCIN